MLEVQKEESQTCRPPSPRQNKTQAIGSKATLPWEPHSITCVSKVTQKKEKNPRGTYQNPKGDDLQYALHGEHGCEDNVQAFQHQLVLVRCVIELPREIRADGQDTLTPIPQMESI